MQPIILGSLLGIGADLLETDNNLTLLASLEVCNHLAINYLGHWTLSMNTQIQQATNVTIIKNLANIHYVVITRGFKRINVVKTSVCRELTL
jgi:hypothetical protein